MFTDKDLAQIAAHGTTLEGVQNQIDNFKNGFQFLPICEAATKESGILSISKSRSQELATYYDDSIKSLKIEKFVPASGAATRMFKELFEYVNDNKMSPSIETLLQNIDKFAFAEELRSIVGQTADSKQIVSAIIKQGLGYGTCPKALIKFHSYPDGSRTAAEEHLVEGAMYAASGGQVNIHFTVSGEHRAGFDKLFANVLAKYELQYGVKYNISFSQQKNSTDTIAVNPDNTPFRESSGELLFRPAGHGALLSNLNDIDADLIYIKTIDNVAPDHLKADTIAYKKCIGGLALEIQREVFRYLNELHSDSPKSVLESVAAFVESQLMYQLPEKFESWGDGEQVEYLRSVLNRPLRVCGMVKNEGEPGGGPFWVRSEDGAAWLQIGESSQIAPDQIDIMRESTHFNPVDLVCAVRDYKGAKFDLVKYTDPATGFISTKSKDGRELKAQELPGLWNGAMANWNTIFVEVPITTFSPVKVVNDLLRPQHA